MTYNSGNRFAAASARIRLAGSVLTVAEPDSRFDQFEMGVVTMFGAKGNFLERNLEMLGVDAFDTWHWWADFRKTEWRGIPYVLKMSSCETVAGWVTQLATMRS